MDDNGCGKKLDRIPTILHKFLLFFIFVNKESKFFIFLAQMHQKGGITFYYERLFFFLIMFYLKLIFEIMLIPNLLKKLMRLKRYHYTWHFQTTWRFVGATSNFFKKIKIWLSLFGISLHLSCVFFLLNNNILIILYSKQKQYINKIIQWHSGLCVRYILPPPP